MRENVLEFFSDGLGSGIFLSSNFQSTNVINWDSDPGDPDASIFPQVIFNSFGPSGGNFSSVVNEPQLSPVVFTFEAISDDLETVPEPTLILGLLGAMGIGSILKRNLPSS
ncbi:MAG: PEP-CTERM sorting domain-containing protein [Spirulina sp.]